MRTTKPFAAAGLLLVLALTGCVHQPSPPRVQHVTFGGELWSASQGQAGVLFQDWAQATAVPGGSLWTFGDTFIGQPHARQAPRNADITGMIGNTIAFLPAGETNLPPRLQYLTNTLGQATNPLTLWPEESAATQRIWPLGSISVSERCYLFYSMIEKTAGPGPWNFRGTGAGLAVANQPRATFTRLRPDGHWRFPVQPAQVVRVGDWLYLYEISSAPKGLILASVPAKQIEQPTAYEFLTGQGWSTNRAQVKIILRAAYGQVSVVWNARLRRYLLATSSDAAHPQEIQLRLARQPEGPWSEPARIAVPGLAGKKTNLIYCAFLHPELSDAAELHYVATFCRVLAGEWDLSNPEWLTFTLLP